MEARKASRIIPYRTSAVATAPLTERIFAFQKTAPIQTENTIPINICIGAMPAAGVIKPAKAVRKKEAPCNYPILPQRVIPMRLHLRQ
jgi:hypothetical protein